MRTSWAPAPTNAGMDSAATGGVRCIERLRARLGFTRMRILGIDYGERRIGLAVSDASATLARPLRTLAPAGSPADRAAAVTAEAAVLAAEPDGLSAAVVGVPRGLDGTPHRQTARALAFIEALRASIGLPVEPQDERLSSVEAERRLALRERDWRKRKARLDAAAAAVILQDYLDERAGGGAPAPDVTGGRGGQEG